MSRRRNARVREIVGQRLRATRKQQHLSQERLGEKSGLSGKFIGEVERGEKSISVDSLHRVARALDVRMPDLVNVDNGVMSPTLETLMALVRREPVRMQSRLLAVAQAMKGGR